MKTREIIIKTIILLFLISIAPLELLANQKLLMLVEKNDISAVKHLVETDSSVDLEAKNEKGNTAFVISVRNSYYELSEFLLSKGALVNVKFGYTDSRTALGYVSFFGKDVKWARLLLRYGANVNHRSPILNAVIGGNIEIVKTLIDAGADVNTVGNADLFPLSFTPLLQAAADKKLEIMDLLVKRGANIHARSNNGDTALLYAIDPWTNNGKVEAQRVLNTVSYLINAGVKINEKGKSDITPLMKSASFCNFELTNLLLKYGAKINLGDNTGNNELVYVDRYLGKCDSRSSLKTANLLIENGVNVHNQNEYGQTPLMLASEIDNLGLVNLYIQNGADVNKKDMNGKSPLMYVLSGFKGKKPSLNSLEIAKMLLDNGADIYARSNNSSSTLSYAVCGSHFGFIKLYLESGATIEPDYPYLVVAANCYVDLEVVRLLSANGATTEAQSSNGDTAIISAARRDRPKEVLEFLIQLGANLNHQNNKGLTALMEASENNDAEKLELLIKSGAQIDMQDKSGETALIKAALSYYDSPLVAKTLIKHGGQINTQDNLGYSALVHSIRKKRLNFFDSLISLGADINQRDSKERTPLIHAILVNNTYAAKRLIDAGANYRYARKYFKKHYPKPKPSDTEDILTYQYFLETLEKLIK